MNIKAFLNRLHRSRTDPVLGGVCSGFGETTATPAWVWRAVFLFSIIVYGTGALLYLILWAVMPVTDNPK